jgi:hypothetical protein
MIGVETVWFLVEITIATGAATLASPVEYRSERACLSAAITSNRVGVFGVLDQSVIVCRRLNRDRAR